MTYRVAVASSDGRNIDLHFARANQFYIYDLHEESFEFIELRKRDVILAHNENEFDKAMQKLHDCTAVIVSQIGRGALGYVSNKGFRVFEAPYPIEPVLEKLVNERILDRKDNA